MCKPSDQFLFCSCKEEKQLLPIGEYNWTLNRYLGSRPTSIRGKIMKPTNDLGDGITKETIIEALDANTCFDFDYTPQERDTFHVDNGKKHPNYEYFKVIYKNGQWQSGSNPSFGGSITENIAQGMFMKKPKEG